MINLSAAYVALSPYRYDRQGVVKAWNGSDRLLFGSLCGVMSLDKAEHVPTARKRR